MSNRLINEDICYDDKINSLDDFEEICFIRLLIRVDDYGRYYRDSRLLRSYLFPRKEFLTSKEVDDAFNTLERVGLIKTYIVKNEPYLEIVDFWKKYKARTLKSKFPPEGAECE